MKILIVDDETEFLDLMHKRLARRGMEVDTADNGTDAVARVEQGVYDAVVLDVKMPGMDGLETLRRIKALRPEVPVVLLTGHASLGAALTGMALGAFDYMLKPVAINELIFKLGEAVRHA